MKVYNCVLGSYTKIQFAVFFHLIHQPAQPACQTFEFRQTQFIGLKHILSSYSRGQLILLVPGDFTATAGQIVSVTWYQFC